MLVAASSLSVAPQSSGRVPCGAHLCRAHQVWQPCQVRSRRKPRGPRWAVESGEGSQHWWEALWPYWRHGRKLCICRRALGQLEDRAIACQRHCGGARIGCSKVAVLATVQDERSNEGVLRALGGLLNSQYSQYRCDALISFRRAVAESGGTTKILVCRCRAAGLRSAPGPKVQGSFQGVTLAV